MTQSIFPSERSYKAMILAAGLGKRMRPLTDNMPKPMVPVNGTTLIDRALNWVHNAGVNDVVVNSHYKAEMLEAHVEKRTVPHITISHENILLETGGGIKKALPLLGQSPFFSANSDTICIDGSQPALHRMDQIWDDSRMDALLLLHPREKAVGFEGSGDFFLHDDGSLSRRGDKATAPYVFTGVQLLHPRLFADSPDGAFSMNLLYNKNLATDGTLSRVYGLVHDGHWLHVGDPDGLKQAEAWLSQH